MKQRRLKFQMLAQKPKFFTRFLNVHKHITMSAKQIIHMVWFKTKAEASKEAMSHLFAGFETLKKIPGVLSVDFGAYINRYNYSYFLE
jgi:hypothetical protein